MVELVYDQCVNVHVEARGMTGSILFGFDDVFLDGGNGVDSMTSLRTDFHADVKIGDVANTNLLFHICSGAHDLVPF